VSFIVREYYKIKQDRNSEEMKTLIYLLNVEHGDSKVNEGQVLEWLSKSKDPIEFLKRIKGLS